MKNNTPFTSETVKKYGLRICRVASQYGVMPADVKRDPENYWVHSDGRPMSMRTRRMILKRDWEKKVKNKASIKIFPSPRRIFVKKSKKKNCVDIYELGETKGITISGGKGTIKMAEGGITSFSVNTCGVNGYFKKKQNAESLEKTIKNQAVKVLNLKTEGIRLPGERPPMEIRDVKDEKPLSKETVWFIFGYAIGVLVTYFVCTWLV